MDKPTHSVVACQGSRSWGAQPVGDATPTLCRLCPTRAPPGATGRLKWPKNTPPEQFAQKNLFLWASRCWLHRGALVFLGGENDRGLRAVGCGEPHIQRMAHAAKECKRQMRKKLEGGDAGALSGEADLRES